MRLTISIEWVREEPTPHRETQLDALVERAEPAEEPIGFTRRPA